MVLYDEGGVYADIDVSCERPVDEWFSHTGDWFNVALAVGIEVVVGDRPDWKQYFDRKIQICQWTIASAPGHPALRLVLDKIKYFFDTHSDEQIANVSVCEATGPAVWSDAVSEYLQGYYNVTLGQSPLGNDQLSNRFSHIGETLVFPLRSFAIGSSGYALDYQKHSSLDKYVLHGFAGSWIEKKNQPWGRDSQGRTWSGSNSYWSGSSFGNKPPGCYDVVLGGRVCQSGESPSTEGSEHLFDGDTDTKFLTFSTFTDHRLSPPPLPGPSANSSPPWIQLNMGSSNGSGIGALVWVSYEFPSPFKLDNYTFVAANDLPARDPTDWDVWASVDNTTWVALSSVRNHPGLGVRKGATVFTMRDAQNQNYTQIRFVFWNISDPTKAKELQLSEIILNHHPPPPPLLPECEKYPFSWSPSRVCSGKNTFNHPESPSRGVDGKKDTKWLHLWKSATHLPYLLIERRESQNYTSALKAHPKPVEQPAERFEYAIISANDIPGRDPRSWNLYALSTDTATTRNYLGIPDIRSDRWILVDSRRNVTFSRRGQEVRFVVNRGVKGFLGYKEMVPLGPRGVLGSTWVKLEIVDVRDPEACSCGHGKPKKCTQIANFRLSPVNPGIPTVINYTNTAEQSVVRTNATTHQDYAEHWAANNVFGYAKTGDLLGKSLRRPSSSPEIPKIIHQSWKTVLFPETVREYVKSWHRLHRPPKWQYRVWTDGDCRELVRLAMPSFLPVYDAYETQILRADASRYLILKVYGGIYADLDFEALKPLDDLIANRSLVLGVEPFAHSVVMYKIPRLACNAIMASIPNHAFWNTLFYELKRRSSVKGISISATGPRALEAALTEYENLVNSSRGTGLPSIYVTHPDVLYPLFDDKNRDIKQNCESRRAPTTSPTISPTSSPSVTENTTARLDDNSTANISISPTNSPIRYPGNSMDIVRDSRDLVGFEVLDRECERLAFLDYKNPTPNATTSFAVHHWVHSWFGGTHHGGNQGFDAYAFAKELWHQAQREDEQINALAVKLRRKPSDF